jgi:hypothetical protein
MNGSRAAGASEARGSSAQDGTTRPPLNVFITVDTEFSPRDYHARNGEVKALVARDIDGVTAAGDFGIGFQMDVLEAYGLRAVFQVESLSASAVGPEILRRVVNEVQARGHEVQMHVHAEWLNGVNSPELPPFRGRNLVSYSQEEQTRVIGAALHNIQEAGARHICAFRAGNYGANRDTLKALARNGIPFDSSYNVCFVDRLWPDLGAGPLTQPTPIEGLWEIPISFFSDWPGHRRPAQLCAVSSREMQHALLRAWEAGWHAFVIVSHSFELIKRPKDAAGPTLPDRLVIDRMENLCRFLSDHKDKFRSALFSELTPSSMPMLAPKPIRSKLSHTLRRMGEQLFGKIS